MNTKRCNLSYILLLCPYPDVKVASRRPRKLPSSQNILRPYKFRTAHNPLHADENLSEKPLDDNVVVKIESNEKDD